MGIKGFFTGSIILSKRMPKTHHKLFGELLNEAKADNNIIGFFLGGSRGKGYEHENSDYDIYMIVKDDVAEEYEKRFKNRKLPEIDLIIYSLSDFKEHAKWGSDTEWARYGFADLKVLVDKIDGEIQKLVDAKGSLTKDKRDEFINAQLDAYLNAFIRSITSYRKRDTVGIRLEASVSIPYLLNAVFALHGRIAPFPDNLAREIQRRPLEKFPWSSEKLCRTLLQNNPTSSSTLPQTGT